MREGYSFPSSESQNSQNFPEVSNNWDMYVKDHPKCSHDIKKYFVGIRTAKLQKHFWTEAGGTRDLQHQQLAGYKIYFK